MSSIRSEILQSLFVNKVVSQIKLNNTTFQREVGFGKGGSNVVTVPLRVGQYDIMNARRDVMNMRAPGAPSENMTAQPVGKFYYDIPRHHGHIDMLMEELNQYRVLGGPYNSQDPMGVDYISRQAKSIAQMISNLREAQTVGMFRDSLYYSRSGDGYSYSFASGTQIPYQIPAGNKTQGNMLGAGNIIGTTWANTAAPILDNLYKINAAFNQLTGMGLRKCYMSSAGWNNVVHNTQVQAEAGSVNQVFNFLNRDDDGVSFHAQLKGFPLCDFVISDNGLNLGVPGSATYTQFVPDTMAIFTTDLGSDVIEYLECSEPVSDTRGRIRSIVLVNTSIRHRKLTQVRSNCTDYITAYPPCTFLPQLPL